MPLFILVLLNKKGCKGFSFHRHVILFCFLLFFFPQKQRKRESSYTLFGRTQRETIIKKYHIQKSGKNCYFLG